MTTRSPLTLALSVFLGSAVLAGCSGEPRVVRDASAAAPSPLAGESAAAAAPVAAKATASENRSGGMAPYQMTVYKSPTCGCCKEWSTYMGEAGFAVRNVETDDVDAVKSEHGLTDASLKSCHTAIIGGYVIEGHVPAADVNRLLAERPAIVGLSAPGMPMMSPGMASREPKDYDVIAFDEAGNTRVWSSY